VFFSEAFAIGSALCIALSSMFVSELKGRVPLVQLARWQMLAAFVMTGLVSLAVGGWRTVDLREFLLLSGSGIAGIAIASTTYFATIYAVGPRVTALLFSLTAPFALALGYFTLHQKIDARQGLGVVLVLIGVVLAIGLPTPHGGGKAVLAAPVVGPPMPPTPSTSKGQMRGITFGIITALGQATGSLLAQPAMAAGVEPLTAMAVRSGLAALIFLALSLTRFGRGSRAAVRPDTLALAFASAFAGTALGMSLLMAALHKGNVGVVSTLSSMTPVLILPMAWIRSRKRPTATAWAGALLAIAGTALISI
jgi:drug/metabolite transporter (DMT)-like permease